MNLSKGNAMIPPNEVFKEGMKYWEKFLVGFFLDSPLSYSIVLYHLKLVWGSLNGIKVKSNEKKFHFNLTMISRKQKY